MQRILSVLLISVFLSAFALADTAQAKLTLVRKSRHHVAHHHAHKATKHHAPKRHSHSV
jgi:hypothetical protein